MKKGIFLKSIAGILSLALVIGGISSTAIQTRAEELVETVAEESSEQITSYNYNDVIKSFAFSQEEVNLDIRNVNALKGQVYLLNSWLGVDWNTEMIAESPSWITEESEDMKGLGYIGTVENGNHYIKFDQDAEVKVGDTFTITYVLKNMEFGGVPVQLPQETPTATLKINIVESTQSTPEEGDTGEEEAITVTIESLYINSEGNNSRQKTLVPAKVGMSWIDFLSEYDLAANVPSDAMDGTSWSTSIQLYGNTGVDNPDRLEENDKIHSNACNITRIGIPSGYERSAFTFGIYQNGSMVESGVGGDIIRNTAYDRFSEEDYAYIKNNINIFPFMRDYLSVPGAQVELSEHPSGYAYIFTITWPDSADSDSILSSGNSASKPATPGEEQIAQAISKEVEEKIKEEEAIPVTDFVSASAVSAIPAEVKGTTTEAVFNISKITTTRGFVAAVDKIVKANLENKTITLYSNEPFAFSTSSLEALTNTNKEFVYMFSYAGHLYKITIPAGAKIDLAGQRFAGPLFIGAQLGTSVLVK